MVQAQGDGGASTAQAGAGRTDRRGVVLDGADRVTGWLLYLFAFVAIAATDLAWVYYMRAVADMRPWLSAILAATLYGVGALTVLAYIAEPGVLVAGALGAMAGTALGVRLKGGEGSNEP